MFRQQFVSAILLTAASTAFACGDTAEPLPTESTVPDQTTELDGKADRGCIGSSCETPVAPASCGDRVQADWTTAPTQACAVSIRDTLASAADFDPVIAFDWDERCETLTEPSHLTAVAAFEDYVEATEGWDNLEDRVGSGGALRFEVSPIAHANGGKTVAVHVTGDGSEVVETNFVFGANGDLLMMNDYQAGVVGEHVYDARFHCAAGALLDVPSLTCAEALAKMENLVSDMSGTMRIAVSERATLPALVASTVHEFAVANGLGSDAMVTVVYEGDAVQMQVELTASSAFGRYFVAETYDQGGYLTFDDTQMSCAPLGEDRVGYHLQTDLDFGKKIGAGDMIATKVPFTQDATDTVRSIGIALAEAPAGASIQLGVYLRVGDDAELVAKTPWASAANGRQEIALVEGFRAQPGGEYWLTMMSDDEVTLSLDRWAAHRIIAELGTLAMPDRINPDTKEYDGGALRAWLVLQQ